MGQQNRALLVVVKTRDLLFFGTGLLGTGGSTTATITAKELILTGTGGSQKVQAFHASGAKAGTRFYAYAKTFTGA